MILINGQPAGMLAVADRGLQYGDGLFETMAYRQGQIRLLDAHLTRLQQGCQNLLIQTDFAVLRAELQTLLKQLGGDCVIKLIITRGQLGRGYKPVPAMPATRIISTHPLPDYPKKNMRGISVKICQTRLGINPLLAGMKHLNRLEQVLASHELIEDPDISEGLLFDIEDHLVEGCFSNVFLVKRGELFTPALTKNGIAGIMRQHIINIAQQHDVSVKVAPVLLADLADADEIFFCNSLIGIWPVTRIVNTQMFFVYGSVTQQFQQWIKTI